MASKAQFGEIQHESEARAAHECVLRTIKRRTLLRGVVGMGVGLASGVGFAQGSAAEQPPTPGDWLVNAKGDDQSAPLTPADIPIGTRPMEAWPMDPATKTVRSDTNYNRLLLLRFDPSWLGPDSRPNAAEGVVAYTVVCTHSACEVTDWVAANWVLECPCHFSRFDPRNNAAVVQGPATRRLPALALTVQDGCLVVAKGFDSKVGGDAG